VTQTTVTPAILTIGLDLGDRTVHLCALNAQREVVARKKLLTTKEALQRELGALSGTLVVLEAGPQSLWISTFLRELGHEVLVVDPRRVKLISQGGRKTDRRDAETLARLAAGMPELLGVARHRTLQGQADLSVMRARDLFVRTRTKWITHARGILKAFGVRVGACSAVSFPRKAAVVIPESLRPALQPILDLLVELQRRIDAFDATIAQVVTDRHPAALLLQQVTGVGPITSAAFVLTIGDPKRFRRSRDVGSWVGLCPRKQESGDSDPQLSIAKTGDTFLRRLLVSAAHYIVGPFGPDCDLRRFGLALAERGGGNAKKRAVVATARKLAVLLHRLWVTGVTYEPMRNNNTEATKAKATA
jgi:transposase